MSSPLNQDEIQMYLSDIRKIKVMTPEREKELSEMVCSGNPTELEMEAIHQELLQGNLRFVITVAKQYQNQGLPMSDLIAEGNLGLMKALKTLIGQRNYVLLVMPCGGLSNQLFNRLTKTHVQFVYQLMWYKIYIVLRKKLKKPIRIWMISLVGYQRLLIWI